MKYTKLMLLFVSIIVAHVSVYAESPVRTQILDNTTVTTTAGEKIVVERTKSGLLFKGYEDKIVLLEAFGHSCPPCQASILGYNRLQKKYQKEIVVIAVEVWGSDQPGLKKYVHQHGITYRAVPKASAGKIITFMQNLTGWTPGIGVPYLMIFSPDGILAKDVAPHGLQEDYVDGLIKGLLVH